MARAAPLVLLALGVAGCATTAATPIASIDRDGAWHEVETRHFVVRTDLDPADALRAAQRLEGLRAALTAAIGRAPVEPRKTHVIVLAAPEYWPGYFPASFNLTRLAVTNERRWVVFADGLFVRSEALAHALAHDVLSPVLARQPRWVGEGLASFLETVELTADGAFVIGRRHAALHREVEGFAPRPLQELWGWDRGVVAPGGEIRTRASAWAWTGYLIIEHPERYLDFVRRLSLAENPAAAFAQSFSGLAKRTLEVGVRSFVQGGDWLTKHPLTRDIRKPARRTLRPEEVDLMHAELSLMAAAFDPTVDYVGAAMESLALVLRRDPANVRAAVLRIYLGGELERTLKLRQLVASHPDDPKAARALAASLMADRASPETQRAAMQRALELDPKSASLLNNLAWLEVKSGAAKTAFPLAQRAVEFEPTHSTYLDTWAAVLFALGECKNAAEVQARAVEVLPDDVTEEGRARYVAALRNYEQQCGPSPFGSAPAVPRTPEKLR